MRTENPHVRAVLSGAYGPEPADCPIGYDVPEHRGAYIVPHEHRALLTHVVLAREELNRYKWFEPYVAHSTAVEAKARELNRLMASRSDQPNGVVEYHCNWYYSVLSDEVIRREHEEFEAKQRAKTGTPQTQEGGLSFTYREQPPEVCGLWEYMTRKETPAPKVRVELKRASLPYIGRIAVHYWLVTKVDGVRERWEVWQWPNVGGASVGHLHRNLQKPESSIGGGPTQTERIWTGPDAERLVEVLHRAWKCYPYHHRYFWWPGPNSNTFVAWALREAGIDYQLSRKGLGRNFLRIFPGA